MPPKLPKAYHKEYMLTEDQLPKMRSSAKMAQFRAEPEQEERVSLQELEAQATANMDRTQKAKPSDLAILSDQLLSLINIDTSTKKLKSYLMHADELVSTLRRFICIYTQRPRKSTHSFR